MKKVIGYLILSSPVIALGLFDPVSTLKALAVASLTVAAVYVGFYLIEEN